MNPFKSDFKGLPTCNLNIDDPDKSVWTTMWTNLICVTSMPRSVHTRLPNEFILRVLNTVSGNEICIKQDLSTYATYYLPGCWKYEWR